MRDRFDVVVIGGGFYGCALALHFRRTRKAEVLLLERDAELLGRASYANQARVHNGYHYPRSFLTALRSRVNYPHFLRDYRDCIEDSFLHWYAVGRRFSNVTAQQFRTFCERIEAPVERAPAEVRRQFDPDLIEDVFLARECAFDAVKLRDRMTGELAAAGVAVRLGAEARTIAPDPAGGVVLAYDAGGEASRATADRVFNCTYSRLNRLLSDSGLPRIPLKHELTEMALVEPPEPFRNAAITVMCGPFFSLMPFPPRGLHTLSHVRYTPHTEWSDDPGSEYADSYERFERLPKVTAYPHMIRDAARYVPALAECRYRTSIWEVKTVLPRNESDDGRPILFRPAESLPGLVNVMGSKIDNIYDVLQQADAERGAPAEARP